MGKEGSVTAALTAFIHVQLHTVPRDIWKLPDIPDRTLKHSYQVSFGIFCAPVCTDILSLRSLILIERLTKFFINTFTYPSFQYLFHVEHDYDIHLIKPTRKILTCSPDSLKNRIHREIPSAGGSRSLFLDELWNVKCTLFSERACSPTQGRSEGEQEGHNALGAEKAQKCRKYFLQ